ncbi:MAG: secondary thiamine-phosphate synthase enzyme YjbQ [Myxococcota bacterium]|nr:secondary thiamine-phosphate synthase enzyme YjbQ [Myxococcota bacterium]
MNQTTITLPPLPRGLHEITERIQAALSGTTGSGLCSVFIHHTSASLLIQENADPDVRTDLEAFFARLIPDGDPLYRHTDEGPDDMPAHVRCAVTATALTIPVRGGRLDLGTWQGVFVWEHRLAARARRLTVTLLS